MAVDRRTTRFGMLATIALVLFSLVGIRLWFLQGVESDKYQRQVSESHLKFERIPAERGRIFDADGRVLAGNRTTRNLTIEWAVVKRKANRDVILKRLAMALGVTELSLQQRYNPCFGMPSVPKCTQKNPYSPLSPMPIADDVSEAQVAYVLERQEDYPGVGFTEETRRVYLFSPTASHVVGYMGAIPKERAKEYQAKGYNLDERVGQFGVELSMEDRLRGTPGRRTVEVDAAGTVVRVVEDVPPIAGDDIQLSIDLDYQQFAEQAVETMLNKRRWLPMDPTTPGGAPHNPMDPKNPGHRVFQWTDADGVKHDYPAFQQHKAPAGSVVVQNNINGQLLALASYPRFDNRWMDSGVSKEKFDQIFPSEGPNGEKADPDLSSLVNRAVQGRYNLGSTIKPFIAWAAMHSALIDRNSWFNDTGTYKLTSIDEDRCLAGAKCVFNNARSRSTRLPTVYGSLQVDDALAVSSDAFFYALGDQFYQLDRTLLKSNLEEFGFGAKTGVELPFEWQGRIPDDKVKADLVAAGVLAKNEVPFLVPGDAVQTAIGQGLMAATPLQLASAYTAIANGGHLMKATVIKAIFRGGVPDKGPAMADLAKGTMILDNTRGAEIRVLEMPPEVLDPLLNGLRRVIRGPGANGHGTTGETVFKGFPRSIPVSGKTGTAQGAASLPWNDSSAFGSFVKDLAHPYTVVAYLEKAGYGSRAAAPVVKCMYGALYGMVEMDPVRVSDPLNIAAATAAPPQLLRNSGCLTTAASAPKD